MSLLHHRLRRLERGAAATAPTRPCAGCGGPPDGRARPPGPVTYRVVHGDQPTGPTHCAVCGRQLVYRLEHDRAG